MNILYVGYAIVIWNLSKGHMSIGMCEGVPLETLVNHRKTTAIRGDSLQSRRMGGRSLVASTRR